MVLQDVAAIRAISDSGGIYGDRVGIVKHYDIFPPSFGLGASQGFVTKNFATLALRAGV